VVRRAAGFSAFVGQHDGYARLAPGLLHTRCLFALDEGAWLILDRLPAQPSRRLASYFHFHPGITVHQTGTGSAEISAEACQWQFTALGRAELTLVQGQADPLQGWYAPQFGLADPCPTIVLRCLGPGSASWGAVLHPLSWGVPRVDITWEAGGCAFDLAAAAVRKSGAVSWDKEEQHNT
jgi:hypothetical protein